MQCDPQELSKSFGLLFGPSWIPWAKTGGKIVVRYEQIDIHSFETNCVKSEVCLKMPNNFANPIQKNKRWSFHTTYVYTFGSCWEAPCIMAPKLLTIICKDLVVGSSGCVLFSVKNSSDCIILTHQQYYYHKPVHSTQSRRRHLWPWPV